MTEKWLIQKEREGGGYTVWSLKPATGDKRDCIAWTTTKREAIAVVHKQENKE